MLKSQMWAARFAVCFAASIGPATMWAQEEEAAPEPASEEAPKQEQPPADAQPPTEEQPPPSEEEAPNEAEPATTEPAPVEAPEEAPPAAEEIYITGSRIKRIDLSTSAPITVLSRQDLDAAGRQSIGAILQNLPSQSNAINIQSNNGGDGSTRVNLRGIGTGRTLVLVNGRRFVPGGSGADNSVDLNAIPAEIIDRVEVLKDGASAIYGSDAIGGVVNIITKRNFSGLEASAYTGGTSNGGFNYALGVTGGESTDKGGFLLSFQWFDQSDLLAGQREFSRQQLGINYQNGEVTTEGSPTNPDGLFGVESDEGNNRWREVLRRSEEMTGEPPFALTRDRIEGFRSFRATGNADVGEGDFYNYQPENYILTPSKRINLWGQGEYRLTKRTRAYFEAMYTNRRSSQLLAPEPLSTQVEGITVSADNAYNPFGRDFGAINRRVVETGNRISEQDISTARMVLGSDGSFTDSGFFSSWRYDLNFGYGRTQGTSSKQGNFVRHKLASAVGPSFFDDMGVARCGTPENVIEDCVPLNLFGGAGTITDEQLRGLTYEGVARGLSDQFTVNAGANGELFDLWNRPVGLAIGYAFRRENGHFVPDPLTNSGDTTGNKTEKTGGGFHENAVFAELDLPLLADLPAVDLLEVNAAVRAFNFNTFGSDATYELGARWQVMNHFAVRSSYSTSFRAPSIAELYSGQADSFPPVRDPCTTFDPVGGASGRSRSANQATNCEADGVPDIHPDNRAQLPSRVGGNENVGAEEATVLTAGVVITPKGNKWIDGVSLTLDYFMVEVTNAIGTKGAELILNNCYNNVQRADCDLVVRDGTGFITSINDTNTNIGGLQTAGLDFGLVYSLPTESGTFRATFDGILLSKFDAILPTRTVQGKGVYDLAAVYPSLRFNAGLSWGWEGLIAGVAGRLIGSYKECLFNDCSQETKTAWSEAVELGRSNPDDPLGIVDDPSTNYDDTRFPERTVSANFVSDIYAGYSFSTSMGYTSLRAGINNVFDSPPPRVFNGFESNSDSNTYDYVGRWFYLSLRHAL